MLKKREFRAGILDYGKFFKDTRGRGVQARNLGWKFVKYVERSPKPWRSREFLLEIIQEMFRDAKGSQDSVFEKVPEKVTISCTQGGQALCQLSEGKLTPLQIQKMLYFANMLYIGENGKDNPLIRNKFLAWKYGPVVRELYERLKPFKGGNVPLSAFDDIVPIIKEDKNPVEGYEKQVKVITDAYNRWSDFSAYKLVQISHWPKGAWRSSLNEGSEKIDNALIWNEYDARYNQ
ncbi:MAG: Panacea domain-containing protein [Hyphomicrobiales bacterium]|nr:Panacea domain-containing protein [Hyphomicrobiales bacterium]